MKWTRQMWQCRKEAQENLKRDKQRRGLRNVMFQSWNEMGYGHLTIVIKKGILIIEEFKTNSL